jgi:integrase
VLVQEILDHHVDTTTVKNHFAEKHYAEWWKERLKGKRLNGITPTLLEDAQRALLAEELASQTVLHYMKFLRHVLNKAVRDGKLERNPFVQVALAKAIGGKTRFLSSEEETKLLKALGPIHGQWARLATLTGLRLSEQFGLRWADVDLDRGVLTLPTTKTGTVQYAFLNAEAKGILRGIQITQMHQGGCGVWVFPSDNPATHLDQRNVYSRIFRPAVTEAKLEAVTWHTLRHTFASRLAMSGQAEGTIAALLRHSTTTLVRRYAHLSPSHLKAAVEQVANFGKPSTPSEEAKEPADSNGTVTKTVTAGGSEEGVESEAVEKIGAGDGI